MKLYTHKLLKEGKICKSIRFKNGVNPKKYIERYGENIEEITIDHFYGNFWRHCKNLKKITVGRLDFCNRGFFYHSLNPDIEEIYIDDFYIKRTENFYKKLHILFPKAKIYCKIWKYYQDHSNILDEYIESKQI